MNVRPRSVSAYLKTHEDQRKATSNVDLQENDVHDYEVTTIVKSCDNFKLKIVTFK